MSQVVQPRVALSATPLNIPVKIALCQTLYPGNIGSVARAMKVMNFDSLYLVQPHCTIDGQAFQLACHADDVLEKAQTVESLAHIISPTTHVIGFCNRRRYQGPQHYDLPEGLQRLREQILSQKQNQSQSPSPCKKNQPFEELLLVFGSENFGLHNHEINFCNCIWQIPTFHENYNSLNLSQAVQIVTYQLALTFEQLSIQSGLHDTKESQKTLLKESLEENSLQGLVKIIEKISNEPKLRTFLAKTTPEQTQNRLIKIFRNGIGDQSDMKFLIGFLKTLGMEH